ncbi:MMPL family transporter [Pseudoalteromonas sp. MMG010]|uniref:MMPL family transporter n=1 Tax=Pseudoalteromonas sp. MMG010 TaxID=2822685 RepID=UPI001B39EC0D|nr:MMPL family transporter [Pseudoalteromonas sp. MMG010]MBQ4833472.1 MMPL family transporter [Pseudoalteromonas sp. MMG010]
MKWIKLSSRNKFFIWCAQLTLLLAVFIYLQLNHSFTVVADINQVFDIQQDPIVAAATNKVEQQQLRQHIVLIGNKDKNLAIHQARAFANKLAELDHITVKSQFSKLPTLDEISQSYAPYAQKLVSASFAKALQSGDKDTLFNLQFNLLNDIGSPWIAATFEYDMTLSLADFFTRQNLPALNLTNEQGFLIAQHVVNDQPTFYVLIYFNSDKPGLDINTAKEIVQHIEGIEVDPLSEVLVTGAAFFTADASRSAEHEMTLYGSLSIVATLLLLCVVYRSMSSVLCTLFVVSVSVLYGFAALQLFFNDVNILTLVFAVTLIGIAADYSFHALSELRFASKLNFKNPLNSIRSSLLLGFITTTAGYLILMLTPLNLFKQIAVFTVAGLFGALLCVMLVFPLLSGFIHAKSLSIPRYISQLNALQLRYLQWRISPIWVWLGTIAVIAVLWVSPSQNDPRLFYSSKASLNEQQQKIMTILGANWDSRYILVQGESAQQTLLRSESLTPLLTRLREQGVIADFSSISTWLPSVNTQKSAQQLIYQGYEQGMFEPLQQLLGNRVITTQDEVFLTPQQWQTMPISAMYANQWLVQSAHFFSVIKLANITDVNVLKHDLSTYEGTSFIDKVGLVSEQIGQFKNQLIGIYLLALLGALIVFTKRYGFSRAVLAVSRPVIAMLLALLCSLLVFEQLSIFNYVAGILILALGLDYCVFYAEHGCCEKITLTTTVSALSSLFVFAILIFSSTPAISQFGFTVFVGVVVVFFIAPRLAQISKRII